MPGLMAGQPEMSHTNDVSFVLPSQEILKLLGAQPILSMYVTMKFGCILYHIYFGIMKLGKL